MIAELEEIVFQAREHAARIISDLELASTREEHVRLTARANEAESISQLLNELLISQLKIEADYREPA